MRVLRSLALLAGIAATSTDAVSVGDAIPSNVDLHLGFPPEMINVGERVAKKKVVVSFVVLFCFLTDRSIAPLGQQRLTSMLLVSFYSVNSPRLHLSPFVPRIHLDLIRWYWCGA